MIFREVWHKFLLPEIPEAFWKFPRTFFFLGYSLIIQKSLFGKVKNLLFLNMSAITDFVSSSWCVTPSTAVYVTHKIEDNLNNGQLGVYRLGKIQMPIKFVQKCTNIEGKSFSGFEIICRCEKLQEPEHSFETDDGFILTTVRLNEELYDHDVINKINKISNNPELISAFALAQKDKKLGSSGNWLKKYVQSRNPLNLSGATTSSNDGAGPPDKNTLPPAFGHGTPSQSFGPTTDPDLTDPPLSPILPAVSTNKKKGMQLFVCFNI